MFFVSGRRGSGLGSGAPPPDVFTGGVGVREGVATPSRSRVRGGGIRGGKLLPLKASPGHLSGRSLRRRHQDRPDPRPPPTKKERVGSRLNLYYAQPSLEEGLQEDGSRPKGATSTFSGSVSVSFTCLSLLPPNLLYRGKPDLLSGKNRGDLFAGCFRGQSARVCLLAPVRRNYSAAGPRISAAVS